jgi:hypothetical protein
MQSLTGCLVTAAIDTYATIEEMLKTVFSVQSVSRLYTEDQLEMDLEETKPEITAGEG